MSTAGSFKAAGRILLSEWTIGGDNAFRVLGELRVRVRIEFFKLVNRVGEALGSVSYAIEEKVRTLWTTFFVEGRISIVVGWWRFGRWSPINKHFHITIPFHITQLHIHQAMKRHHSELGSSSSSSPTTNANTVKEGDTVILSFKDKSFFAYVSSSTTLGKTKIGKANVSTRPLLNLPYGSVVELQNKKTFFHTEDDEISPEVYDFDFDSSQAKDNRNLLSSKLGNDSQNLSGEDITKLQQSGSSGGDIISKLIENSSTFAGKTEFSKAKYIAKKQLKYQPRARIIRCLASTICSVMFGRNPGKIMNIR